MAVNSFDTDIAMQVGVKAAILFENIWFWCEKNEANGVNEHDGRYWTYNSVRAFEVMFPYLSKKEIRYALENLEQKGFIISGNFNKNSYDRTKWYSISDFGKQYKSICKDASNNLRKCENTFSKKENYICQKGKTPFIPFGEPIPDNKHIPDINTDIKPNNKKDILSDSVKKNADEVIDYLNQQTGQHYRHTPSSEKHIIARLNDGFTVNDCKDVIDKKATEWLNDEKMQKYLRPETLFGSKFENYLNQRTVTKEKEMSYEEIGKILDGRSFNL